MENLYTKATFLSVLLVQHVFADIICQPGGANVSPSDCMTAAAEYIGQNTDCANTLDVSATTVGVQVGSCCVVGVSSINAQLNSTGVADDLVDGIDQCVRGQITYGDSANPSTTIIFNGESCSLIGAKKRDLVGHITPEDAARTSLVKRQACNIPQNLQVYPTSLSQQQTLGWVVGLTAAAGQARFSGAISNINDAISTMLGQIGSNLDGADLAYASGTTDAGGLFGVSISLGGVLDWEALIDAMNNGVGVNPIQLAVQKAAANFATAGVASMVYRIVRESNGGLLAKVSFTRGGN